MNVQVDPADVSHEVDKIQDAAQSYTKADGEVVRLMLQKPALLLPKKCYMISALIKVFCMLLLRCRHACFRVAHRRSIQ